MPPAETLKILEYIVVITLGLSFGSFATVLAHRGKVFTICAGDEKDSRAARSYCPRCKARLGIVDLIPVLSWLAQKGRCRHCSAPISSLYPAIEMAVLLMALSYFLVYGLHPFPKMLAACAAFAILAGLFVFDVRSKILPNNLVAVLGVIGIFYRFWPAYIQAGYETQIIEYGGGAFVYAAFIWIVGWAMQKFLRKPVLGMGDVKFFAAAGLWLGISNLGTFCMLSGVFGVIFGLFWRKIKGEAAFPFGPALIISFFVLLLLDGSHWP
ncbi:MAG: prepilin peptidase [Alphaproteobacteria bacterium]